jgi:hypothetical protein
MLITIGYTVASNPLLWGHIDISPIPKGCCDDGLHPSLSAALKTALSLTLHGRIDLPNQFLKDIINLTALSPRLTSLTLRSAVDINEWMLKDLFKFSRDSLLHVDLSFCHHIGSFSIVDLIAHHPSLRTLNLSHTCVTDDALLLLHQLHHLTDLSLEGCFNLSRASMSQFLQTSLPPRLSRLNLSYLFTVLGEWLASSSGKFERLDVRHVEHITKRDVRDFRARWGTECEVLTTARLETDDERGWTQYVDEIIKAEVVH